MQTPSASRPILITGASGFVGQYLLRELSARGVPGDHIAALGIAADQVKDVSQIYKGDISDRAFVDASIKAATPSVIIHLAAIAEPAKAFQDQELAWQVNVEGTRHVAAAFASHASDGRMVFAGSAESYGESFNTHSGPITEDAALAPKAFYGATKAISDIMLGQMQSDGLDVVRIRAFNHTGPGQPPAYVVPAFAEQVAKIEAGAQPPVMKVGNLDAVRDFLDVRDVVAAYATLTERSPKRAHHQAYNISSGTPRKISDILNGLVRLSDAEISVEQDPARMRASEVPVACGDSSAFRDNFGWEPAYSFEQTLKDTLEAFRKQYGAG